MQGSSALKLCMSSHGSHDTPILEECPLSNGGAWQSHTYTVTHPHLPIQLLRCSSGLDNDGRIGCTTLATFLSSDLATMPAV
jgi:hypothetical protein